MKVLNALGQLCLWQYFIHRFKVEELPGACQLTLYDFDKNDAGPYLVIFPYKLRDNTEFELTLGSE